MAEQTDLSYAGRTLVVILCAHRSGSSLVTNWLQRLGVSLGPFELIGASESNKYGHFEAAPFCTLNRELQTQVFGFPDDLPPWAEVLDRFCKSDGRWPCDAAISRPALERGAGLVRQLVESAPVSGFKDPRTVLLWPFWSRVLLRFPGLRIVPVFVARSPHEIAMSLFMRSKGAHSYQEALDVTAVHFKRMYCIRESCPENHALVRFHPQAVAEDMRRVAELCGLAWSEETLGELYDATRNHHQAAIIAHPAQEAFERLGLPSGTVDLARVEEDAALRENVMRSRIDRACLEMKLCQEESQQRARLLQKCEGELRQHELLLAAFRSETPRPAEPFFQTEPEIARLGQEIRQSQEENRLLVNELDARHQQSEEYLQTIAQLRGKVAQLHRAQCGTKRRASRLAARLNLMKGSRTWRLRNRLVTAIRCVPGLSQWRRPKTSRQEPEAPDPWSVPAIREGNRPHFKRHYAWDQMPKVAVIIVNYNGLEHLPACLESLFTTDYPAFDVTLVDNGSRDESVGWVRARYPQVKIIDSPVNLGFGKANHLGILQSDAPVIALLNNDTVVDHDWLWALVEPLVADDNLAATSAKLRFLDNRRVLNGVGGGMNYLGLAYDVGIHEVDCGQWDQPREVLFPCGAACAIRRSAFEAAGGFDEQFFMYHEDVDLGWRLRLLGYSIRTAPQSVVYHRFGGTSRRATSAFFREELGLRHDLRSLIKNYQWRTLCRILPLFFLFLLKASWDNRTFRYIKCLTWNLIHLPSTLKQRWVIQRNRRISDRQLSTLIFPYPGTPFHHPDYKPLDRAAFLQTKSKKAWVNLADHRWRNLGHGWYFVESAGGAAERNFRWSQREAVVYLWNHFGRGVLEMEVVTCAADAHKPQAFSVSVNNQPPSRFLLHTNDWKTVRVEYSGPPGPLEVTVRAEKTWSPGKIFRNNDRRELGIGLRQIQFQPFTETPKAWGGISVIIPTYNRCEKLLRTLKSLEAQTLSKRRFEVIVIDDGSTDATRQKLAEYRKTSRLRITCASQQNKLQAAARNHGITLAKEDLLLFIGDDIIPSRDFLRQHLDFHRRHNPCGDVAVVGQIRWHKNLRVTPFMQFVNDYGAQFGFALMRHRGPWQFDCFYTSNISLPRQMLEKLDYVFDEDFNRYGWEDAELGYRLESNGMRLLYNVDAVAYHDHATTLRQFCRRQYEVGRCSRVFLDKHPELESHLGSASKMRRRAMEWPFWDAVAWVAHLVDLKLRIRLPASLYCALLGGNYARGVVAGQADQRPAGPAAAAGPRDGLDKRRRATMDHDERPADGPCGPTQESLSEIVHA
jgi:GT2 family glycosyltransferase